MIYFLVVPQETGKGQIDIPGQIPTTHPKETPGREPALGHHPHLPILQHCSLCLGQVNQHSELSRTIRIMADVKFAV